MTFKSTKWLKNRAIALASASLIEPEDKGPASPDDSMVMRGVMVDDAMMLRLRLLRLWHWRQYLSARRSCESFEVKIGDAGFLYTSSQKSNVHLWSVNRDQFKKVASFHIKAVQSLNDFFPGSDYAMNDEDKYPEEP
jgi:hypothetical protein